MRSRIGAERLPRIRSPAAIPYWADGAAGVSGMAGTSALGGTAATAMRG